MSIWVKNQNDKTIILVNSSVSLKRNREKLQSLINFLAKSNKKNIIIDIENYNKIDNKYLETIIKCAKKCKEHNCKISLCGMNHEMLCVFYILKLDEHVELYQDEFDAVFRENRLVRRKLKAV